jgi:chromosome segregation ATPase
MTEKLRKEKDSLEGQLNPLVNKFNQHKQGIEIKKQELASIENKSQKLKGEIETIRNHISLNMNKVKVTAEDIEKFKTIV